MKCRIAIWATLGALVVVGWSLYISAISPIQLTAKAFAWTLACLTCPIALAHRYPLSVYVVLLANAATYALVGVIVETIQRLYRPLRLQFAHRHEGPRVPAPLVIPLAGSFLSLSTNP